MTAHTYERDTLTYGANHLFIFGGALAYHDKRKGNDLFVTNLDRVVWRKTSAYGAGAPRERDGHAAVFDAARRRLLIFGGKSKEKKRLDDLYAYDLDEDRWMPLSPDGRRPDAREGAKMVALDENTAVLFGGKGQGARFNDVYVLDMSSKDCAWSTPVCAGAIPTPRQDVALCASDGVVYLHAGRDNFVRDDLYALDLSDRANPAWEELTVSGRRPMPCYGHEIAFVDGKLWTYGGFDELGGQCSKVYRLDFAENAGGVGLDKTDGEWTEMESELSLNESRIGVISPDGTLHSLQVGSADAKVGGGAVNTPEEMYWDVYKVGDVLDLDERELRPEDLVPVNGKKLRVEHTTTSKGKEYLPRVRAPGWWRTRAWRMTCSNTWTSSARSLRSFTPIGARCSGPSERVRRAQVRVHDGAPVEAGAHVSVRPAPVLRVRGELPGVRAARVPSAVPERRPVAVHGDGVASRRLLRPLRRAVLAARRRRLRRVRVRRVRAEARHDQRPNRAGVPRA